MTNANRDVMTPKEQASMPHCSPLHSTPDVLNLFLDTEDEYSAVVGTS